MPYGLDKSPPYVFLMFYGEVDFLPAFMPVRNLAMFAYSFGTSDESKSSPSAAFVKEYGTFLILGTLPMCFDLLYDPRINYLGFAPRF